VAEALNAGNADQSSNDKCVQGARSAENYSNENKIIETSEDLEEEMNSGNESDQSSSDELVEGAINAGNGSYGNELIMENKPEEVLSTCCELKVDCNDQSLNDFESAKNGTKHLCTEPNKMKASKSLNDNSGIIDETDHDRTIKARTEGSLLVRSICDSYQLCPSRSTSPLLIEKQLSPCAQNKSNDEDNELLGLAEMIASMEEHEKNTVEVSTPPKNNNSSFAIFKTPEKRNSQIPSLDENGNSAVEVSTLTNDNHATGFKTPIKDVEGPYCKCIPPKPSVRRFSTPKGNRFDGRPYFSCASRKCTFWRIAPTPKKADKQVNQVNNYLEGLKLPTSIKHKGRPKRLGKTTVVRSKGTSGMKKPPGALTTPFQLKLCSREIKARDIPEDAIKPLGDGSFTVQSCTDKNKTYIVSKSFCTCADFSIRKSDVCKHILRLRQLTEENSTDSLEKYTVALIENSSACCICNEGEPSHSCDTCQKPVHATNICSKATIDGDGYGKPRRCLSCTERSVGKNCRKRPPQEDFDLIEKAPLPTKKAVPPKPVLSQTSRSGRNIKKKVPFTPTKE
ncbi:Peregrin, partial [Frankliniella fusca]